MIEGKLNITMKGGKTMKNHTSTERSAACLEFRRCSIFLQGYSFLKEMMPCLEGKLQAMNERSILT